MDSTADMFTPGPWKAAMSFQNNGPDYYTVYDGPTSFNRTTIATVTTAHNARLIAAAPDLLEAAKRVHDDLVDCGMDSHAKILWEVITKAEDR